MEALLMDTHFLGLAFLMLVQFAGIIWWASGVSKTQLDYERRIKAIEELQAARAALLERFMRSEGKIELLEVQTGILKEEIYRRLERIEAKLDVISDRQKNGNAS